MPPELGVDADLPVTEEQLADYRQVTGSGQSGAFVLKPIAKFLQRGGAAVNRGLEIVDRDVGRDPEGDIEGITAERDVVEQSVA